LAQLLEHPNSWQRRQAQRLIAEKFNARNGSNAEKDSLNRRIKARLEKAPDTAIRLALLWTASDASYLAGANLTALTADRDPVIRAWAARITGMRLRRYYDARLRQEAAFPERLLD